MSVMLCAAAPTVLAHSDASISVEAPTEIEFNRHFLIGGASTAIDLSHFEAGAAIEAGVYTLDVHINGNWVAQAPIRLELDASGTLLPCLSLAVLGRWGVDVPALKAQSPGLPDGEFCDSLTRYVEHARSDIDHAGLVLRLSIPDIYLVRRARDWVDPSQWDPGIPAGLVDYTASAHRSIHDGQRALGVSLGLRLGVNAGAWRLRHTGFVQWEAGRRRHHDDGETYLQRDIRRWRALLVAGDGYTAGDIFSSIRFKGIRLASDDRMLPQSQRGYAPVIQGTASGPARVRVYQQGRLLHEVAVAAGPFAIDDLYATAYNGDLEVVLTEADGREERFTQPFSSVPNLLRPGQVRFSVAAGRAAGWNVVDDSALFEATLRRGLDNRTTLHAGARGAEQFQAAALGSAFNTGLGAVAVDVIGSKAQHPNGQWWRGHAYRATYSRSFPTTDTHVSVAAYRHASGRYLDLGELLALRGAAGLAFGSTPGRQRDRFEISMSQSLPGQRGRLWGNGIWTSFRDGQRDQSSFSVGYSASTGKISYAISARRSWLAESPRARTGPETSVNLTLSTPLGRSPGAPNLLASASHYSAGEQARLGLSGNAGTQVNYTAGVEHLRGRYAGADAGLFYQGRAASAHVNVSSSQAATYTAAGLAGAAVIHAGGITLAAALGETTGLVSAQGAGGSRVNHDNTRLDRRGFAVVPHLTPYRVNQLHIDPLGAPANLRFASTSATAVPTAGAVAYFDFNTHHYEDNHAFIALLPDGRAVPFGARILAPDGEPLGVIGQSGQAWFATSPDSTHVTLRWQAIDATAMCEVSLLDVSITRQCHPPSPAAGAPALHSTPMEY
jgi:outer membrane usher protein